MHLNRGYLEDMPPTRRMNSYRGNPYSKVRLNFQKSVQVIVPKKLLKDSGGKDLTVTARQTQST
jgi:hypothetical protein